MTAGKRPQLGVRSEAQERRLVEAAQKDPAHFADLYEDNFHRVYGYVISRVKNRHTAEDLTAEVFHKALAHLGNFDWRGIPFSAWLIRIAANVMSDEWKRSGREQTVDELPEVPAPGDLDKLEERARLFRAVEQLPANQRRVVHMRFVEGKSIREIAQELGRTEGAVKQLQLRALQNLRSHVEAAHA